MKKLTAIPVIVLAAALLFGLPAQAKPHCNDRNGRNPHCQPTATATARQYPSKPGYTPSVIECFQAPCP